MKNKQSKIDSKKRSPLKNKPLRYAGKSIDEQIDKLINDNAVLYLVISLLSIAIAGFEWIRFYINNPPSPKMMTFLAFVVILFSYYKIKKISREVKRLKLGREGERVVGEHLDMLREKGYKIFHDIVGENFNIDHVIISTKGIFVIETKTFSKPNDKDARIHFNGREITVDRQKLSNNYIDQATASSKWLRNLLKESTGKEFPIKPGIVFPGWFIETTEEGKKSSCWVLNPRALPQYIENEKTSITMEDASLASYHLSRYIRAIEEEKSKTP
ncbi:MAG: NERD domain-containing protein [Nitrospirae bacterium]|nr:MAG: NERD domain-containing protein [Nitrospirota bacterium]